MGSRMWAWALVVVCASVVVPVGVGAQLRVEVLYGADRNVDDGGSELDGWMNATVEWVLASGIGIGVGTDHHFEDAAPRASDHEGWALYLSSSYTWHAGRWGPFLRAGVGAGRAPCDGDTCTDGLYLRGSAGIRMKLSERFGLAGEAGLSRISRPLGGIGLWLRP